MKKSLFVVLGAAFFVSAVSVSILFAKSKDETQPSNNKGDALRQKTQAMKAELNGSEWKVKLVPSNPKEKTEEDTLTFQNGQIKSKILSDRGFNATNYTVTVSDSDGPAVWETMQTSTKEKEGVVFIRGEWKGSQMRGVFSQQIAEGQTRDYNFSTESKVAVAPTTEKKEEKKVEVKEAPAPVVEAQQKTEQVAAEVKSEVASTKEVATATTTKSNGGFAAKAKK